jgi:hypothetical protein
MTVVTIDGGKGQLSVGGMDIDIEAIVIPSDWDGDQDLQFLEDTFGDEWEASGLAAVDFLLRILSDAQQEAYIVVDLLLRDVFVEDLQALLGDRVCWLKFHWLAVRLSWGGAVVALVWAGCGLAFAGG